VFGQTIPRTGRGPILFACPINDKAGHNGELSAELIITRLVGKQSLLACSSSFDPLTENFAGFDRAWRRGRDPLKPASTDFFLLAPFLLPHG
jgi:hypothetical protein